MDYFSFFHYYFMNKGNGYYLYFLSLLKIKSINYGLI